MTSEQVQLAIDLFDAALALPPEERGAWLQSACAGDETLRSQVEELLQSHEEAEAEDFLGEPALPDPSAQAAGLSGRMVGPYQLLRELGSGGMGVVYLAVRADDAYWKEVAVKLIWPGAERESLLRRFKQERRILARLEHPNIARLLDGGATESPSCSTPKRGLPS
jgi:serine/threonine protein kinase